MYSIEETIRINNPEPGEYEKHVKKNIEFNKRFKTIYLDDLSYEKKQEELNKVFEGR